MTQEQTNVWQSLQGLGFAEDTFEGGDFLKDVTNRSKLNTAVCQVELLTCKKKDGSGTFLKVKVHIGEGTLVGHFRGTKTYGTPMIGHAEGDFNGKHYSKGVLWFE